MRRYFLMIVLLCWLVGALGGLRALARYTATPGVIHSAPRNWPAQSGVLRVAGRATLLLFAHPRCPCTRATLTEWNRLLAQCGEQVTPTILFVHPQNTDVNWTQTDLYAFARRLPNQIIDDKNDQEAQRFHAGASGLVLLYGADGKLLFRGGITPGRGHEGNSAGKDALLALLNGQTPSQNHSPVFGCSLFASE